MTYFGSGWQNSGIEIREPAGTDYYQAKDVPHGHVGQQWYFSKVTGKWRRCFVYTPPDYGKVGTAFLWGGQPCMAAASQLQYPY
jgi:hypothetical protein